MYIQKALNGYQNSQCVSLEEFNEDLARVVTIKKSITRYKNGDDLNIRLLINQFIILFNVFGDTAYQLIKYKIDTTQYPTAFAFLAAINQLPDYEMVMLDQFVVEQIKKEIS